MTTKYRVFAEQLGCDIRSGRLLPGERLPGELALAGQYQISRQTVRQGLHLLAEQGLIETRKGSGSCVKAGARCIAIVPAWRDDCIFPAFLQDVQQTLSARGYTTAVLDTRNEYAAERTALGQLLTGCYSGALVEGVKTALPCQSLDLYAKLAEKRFPLVFYHSRSPQLPAAVCVCADNYQGGYQLTRYLLGLGHRQIAGIFQSDDMRGTDRYAGYLAALRDAGLPLPDGRVFWYSTADRRDYLDCGDTAFLHGLQARRLHGCTAVLCETDELAYLLIRQLRAEGVRVPEDLSVAAFGASCYLTAGTVRITSLAVQTPSVATAAAARLLEQLAGRPAAAMPLPWTLLAGDSTAPRKEC